MKEIAQIENLKARFAMAGFTPRTLWLSDLRAHRIAKELEGVPVMYEPGVYHPFTLCGLIVRRHDAIGMAVGE